MHVEPSDEMSTTNTPCCAVRWLHINANHSALPGHFPGRPVVPGVVLLEHIQQLLHESFAHWQLRALPNVKFLRPVLPEQPILLCLELHTTTIDQADHLTCGARFAIRSVGDTPTAIAQGQLSLQACSTASTATDATS